MILDILTNNLNWVLMLAGGACVLLALVKRRQGTEPVTVQYIGGPVPSTDATAQVTDAELHTATDEARHLADVFKRLGYDDSADLAQMLAAELWYREPEVTEPTPEKKPVNGFRQ